MHMQSVLMTKAHPRCCSNSPFFLSLSSFPSQDYLVICVPLHSSMGPRGFPGWSFAEKAAVSLWEQGLPGTRTLISLLTHSSRSGSAGSDRGRVCDFMTVCSLPSRSPLPLHPSLCASGFFPPFSRPRPRWERQGREPVLAPDLQGEHAAFATRWEGGSGFPPTPLWIWGLLSCIAPMSLEPRHFQSPSFDFHPTCILYVDNLQLGRGFVSRGSFLHVIGIFRPFTFNVIFYMVGFGSLILLIICCSLFLVSSFPVFFVF